MTISRRWVDVEVTASVRREVGHLSCAFVSALYIDNRGQRSILFSRHIALRDEALIDQVIDEVREQLLEHALSYIEPF